jgi:hypothetical protein
MAAPQYFKTVDLASLALEPLVKDGRIYVAKFTNGPLLVQSPVVTVRSVAEGVAWLQPTGPFRDFLRRTEEALKNLARAQAGDWNISEDQVERSFKTFFDGDAFKVRLHPDFAAYDVAGDDLDAEDADDLYPGTMRLLLELDRLSVGKTEMGGLWRLVQLRVAAPPPPCLIDLEVEVPDDEELAGPTGAPENDDFV